jgi:hypothetical protein
MNATVIVPVSPEVEAHAWFAQRDEILWSTTARGVLPPAGPVLVTLTAPLTLRRSGRLSGQSQTTSRS